METWILIVVMHGWGAGIGSTGNAVTMQEFTSHERCSAASKILSEHATKVSDKRNLIGYCVPR